MQFYSQSSETFREAMQIDRDIVTVGNRETNKRVGNFQSQIVILIRINMKWILLLTLFGSLHIAGSAVSDDTIGLV